MLKALERQTTPGRPERAEPAREVSGYQPSLRLEDSLAAASGEGNSNVGLGAARQDAEN